MPHIYHPSAIRRLIPKGDPDATIIAFEGERTYLAVKYRNGYVVDGMYRGVIAAHRRLSDEELRSRVDDDELIAAIGRWHLMETSVDGCCDMT